jgi:hypothetical protein
VQEQKTRAFERHSTREHIPHTLAALLARSTPLLLALLALFHGLLYAVLVPPWQIPDEPALFEYAALAASLGRVPTLSDSDPALERQIADSLVHARFFEYLTGKPASPPPQSLDQARELFFMPSQIGTDPPLYFFLAALPLRLLAAQPIEGQLLALRVLGVLFTTGAVLCTYGAARELLPRHPCFALAAGALVLLQPMFVFVGAGAGNDSLANLLGAALTWTVLRTMRRGMTGRRAAGLLALMLLGALTKRTLLPPVLLLVLAGGAWAIGRLPGLRHRPLVRLAIGLAVALAVLGGVRALFEASRNPAQAAEWVERDAASSAERTLHAPGTGRAALALQPGQVVVQGLPDVAAEWAQNQELHFTARVWAAGGKTRGKLTIDFGWASVEQPFEVSKSGRVVRMHTFIPLYCPYVAVMLQSDGALFADQLHVHSDRRSDVELAANPDLATAAVAPGSLASRLVRYLRLREFGWIWRSGRLLEPPPLGWGLARIFFVSFWGQFGWMSLPLVGGTPWEGALWLLCAGGLVGIASQLLAANLAAWQRRAVGLLLLLILSGLLLPLANAYTQPRNQVIQQGRYLFTAMAPIALLLALGWRALVPQRWRTAALCTWAGFGALFAAAAIALIVRAYG